MFLKCVIEVRCGMSDVGCQMLNTISLSKTIPVVGVRFQHLRLSASLVFGWKPPTTPNLPESNLRSIPVVGVRFQHFCLSASLVFGWKPPTTPNLPESNLRSPFPLLVFAFSISVYPRSCFTAESHQRRPTYPNPTSEAHSRCWCSLSASLFIRV